VRTFDSRHCYKIREVHALLGIDAVHSSDL
jgi:hypothetical protein